MTCSAVYAQTYSLTPLANFDATNGTPDSTPVSDSYGNLFGTTSSGGTNGTGVIYKITNSGTLANPNYSSSITTLTSFGSSGTHSGLTIDGSGNLIGALSGNGNGSIFQVAAGSTSLTTLASFNGVNGSSPLGTLAFDSQGNLYGATGGTIFKIANTGASTNPIYSSTITTLQSFTALDYVGGVQAGVVINANDELFAFRSGGYTSNLNKIDLKSNTFSTLLTSGLLDYYYSSIAIDKSGNLYGFNSSSNSSSIKIAANTYTPTTFGAGIAPANFRYAFDNAGNIFGLNIFGGFFGAGSVYEIPFSSLVGGYINIYPFDYKMASITGQLPVGIFFNNVNSNIYGVTSAGGTNNKGTVFMLAPSATVSSPEPESIALLVSLGVPVFIGAKRRRSKS